MLYIGIDPDVNKCGVALWNGSSQSLTAYRPEPFEELRNTLYRLATSDERICVVLESGWLNKKANWHGKKGQSEAVKQFQAGCVGRNLQVGRMIYEFCKLNNIPVILKTPNPKVKKWDAVMFKAITGETKRTNEDVRDAVRFVYGLPDNHYDNYLKFNKGA